MHDESGTAISNNVRGHRYPQLGFRKQLFKRRSEVSGHVVRVGASTLQVPLQVGVGRPHVAGAFAVHGTEGHALQEKRPLGTGERSVAFNRFVQAQATDLGNDVDAMPRLAVSVCKNNVSDILHPAPGALPLRSCGECFVKETCHINNGQGLVGNVWCLEYMHRVMEH
jgi:hypothetical protein